MEFQCLAQNKEGERIKTRLNADSLANVVSRLKNEGLLPLEIKPVKERLAQLKIAKLELIKRTKVSTRELAIFTRQLSLSLSAGILLIEALETIAEDLEHRHFRKIIQKLAQDIRGGASFSAALAKFPEVFSTTFVALVKTGEESGSLDRTLANLAKYLEDSERAMQKLKSAIRYPAFVFGFFLFTIFVIVTFIIPKFKAMFFRSGMQLPLLTRVVTGISEFTIKHFFWLPVLAIIFGLSFWLLLKNPKFRLFYDTKKLKIPILGKIIHKTLVSRFARTLSILISGGVGLAKSLTISSQVTNNVYVRILIDRIRERVISGFPLSEEMNKQKFFAKMFVKMVQVGEKTGKISEMFRRNADYYDEELERAIANFTSLLEPALIILIGAVVLVVVLALYLPIFKMAMIRR